MVQWVSVPHISKGINMQCSCGEQTQMGDRFCPRCGKFLSGQWNAINNAGGIVMGDQYQAGGDIYVSPADSLAPTKAYYNPVPKWRSPFTQAVLSWIGVITGMASLFPFWKLLKSLTDFSQSGVDISSNQISNTVSLMTFLILFVLLVFSIRLRTIAEKQLRIPLVRGWAINGYNHRITIERVKGSRCPQCKGKMKYYNKPVEWQTVPNLNGRDKHQVTKRVPALECLRNPDHCYEIDPAEELG